MSTDKWIPIHELDDNAKIWAGTLVRIDNLMFSPDETTYCYDDLVSFIYDNAEYLQLTCLTQGEAGNIMCVLKKDLPNHYALGSELKRMVGFESASVRLEE